jgi:glycosyltransferase involved in cell wall biosynthesis
LNRVLEPLASAHLADSNAQRETLARAGRIPASKIAVIPPGIDPDGFMRPSSRERMRASLGVPDGAEVAGVVAPLHPEEDHRTFLLAARFVVDELASARFLIVGAGPLEEDLRREIRALDLEGRAHLLGARSDVPEVLSALDLSVLVSRGANALPSSLLESMAAGLAIVGTDAGGVSEILENGVNGLLVRPRDAEGLARAMLELIRDPARRAHMGSASRRIVAERFTQAAMIARYEGLLERFLRLRRNPVRRS